MARAGILYSHVAQAAAKIAAEGKNPTVDNVREALGQTGSKSTIAPMLKRWKSEHQETVAEAELGLPTELVHAVKDLYAKLQTDVAVQLQNARDQHTKELDIIRGKLDSTSSELNLLSDLHNDISSELKRTEQQLAERVQDLQANAIALTGAQTENAGLKQRLADRAAEVGSVNQQLVQARTQFEHFQEATARQRSEERQMFEHRIARIEHDRDAGQRRQEAQQTTLAQQDVKLAHLMLENDRLQQAITVAQSELGAALSERDRQTTRADEMVAARDDAAHKLDAKGHALSMAVADAAVANKQAEMLTRQLAVAEKKADQAEQEKTEWIDKMLLQRQDYLTAEGSRSKDTIEEQKVK